jgi:hypothetical protein
VIDIDRNGALWQARQQFVAAFLKPEKPRLRSFALGPPIPDPQQNVVGVGITQHPDHPSTPALTAFVTKKFPDSALTAAQRLPDVYAGQALRVEEVGAFRRLAIQPPYPDPKAPLRPAQPGNSVGIINRPDTTGTITAIVIDAKGVTYVLSCNHVLADENAATKNATQIVQPGQAEQAPVAFPVLATLSTFVALDPMALNTVDCAIARVINPQDVSTEILAIGRVNGTTSAQLGMQVHAFGRTSTYMSGTVTALGVTANIEYGLGMLSFDDQIFISGSQPGVPFSAAGDSGSLVVEQATGKAIGMVIAGRPSGPS